MDAPSVFFRLAACVFICGTAITAKAATIEAWDFVGKAGNEASVAATTIDAGLQTGTISRGSGITAAADADSFAAINWGNTIVTNDPTDYFEFSVTPVPGYLYSITSLTFNIQIAGSFTGPLFWSLRSGANSFTSDLDFWSMNSPGLVSTTHVSILSSFTNLSTSTVFRLYGYDNSSGAGNNGRLEGTGDDLVVGGTVTFDATGDVDGDGIPNGWEKQYFTNAVGGVASNDDDQDRFTVLQEFIADTDPTSSNSHFKVENLIAGNSRDIFYLTSSQRVYTLEYDDDLTTTNWLPLQGLTNILGNGSLKTFTDTNAVPARHYRLRVALPPP